MSLATSLAAPAIGAGTKLLRGETLRSMARAVGVVLSAGTLAAIYQLTHDEAHSTLSSWRQRSKYRQQRHEVLLIEVLSNRYGQLSPVLRQRFLHSRDAFKVSLAVLADPTAAPEDRKVLQDILRALQEPRVIEP